MSLEYNNKKVSLREPRKQVSFLYLWVGIVVLGVGLLGGLILNKYVFAANTCTSLANGYWNATTTWTGCGDLIPQAGDDVIIDHVVTVNTGNAINAINSLTVNVSKILRVQSNEAQTVDGNIIVNGSIESYSSESTLNLTATNITINSGGEIKTDYDGYLGGNNGDGSGPVGAYGIRYNPGSGSGAAHAGAGGDTTLGGAGGMITYCTTSSPSTYGAGGGGAYYGGHAVYGGQGGGLLLLTVSNNLIINGSISSDGNSGGYYLTVAGAGGGAGGGIKITAGNIYGTPENLKAVGGIAGGQPTPSGGAGGGGCILLEVSGNNTILQSYGDVSKGFGGGSGAEDGAFNGYNTPPTTTVMYPSQTSFYDVTVTTTVSDVDSHETDFIVEHSVDGTTWVSSTIGTVSQAGEGGDGVTTSTGSITGIDTNVDGSVDLTFTWVVETDLPNTDDDAVYIRVIPSGAGITGVTNTSTAFAINTLVPSAPGALTVNSTSTTSVILNYGATSTDNNFAEYKIFYANSSTPVTESDTAFTSSSDANLGSVIFNNVATTTIPSLSVNTLYYMNIWVYDDWSNVSSSPSEVNFYTLAPTPSGLANSAVATSTASFGVGAFANDSTGSSGYYFDLTTTVGGTPVSNSGWQSGSSTWSASLLDPNTGYTVEVKYRNGDGVETAVASLSFYTLSSDLSGVSATANSTSQITVAWSGDSTEYYAENITAGTNSGWTTSTSYAFTSLTPNTSSTFRVKGRNAELVETSWSSDISATTECSVPGSVTATANSTSQITVAWTGDATLYYVENTTSVTNSGDISGTSYAFTGLTANTAYTFKVKGKNSAGVYSALSGAVSATTNSNPGPGPGPGTPTYPSGSFIINNGAVYTSSTNINLLFDVSDTSSYTLSENSTLFSSPYQSINNNPGSFSLSSGEGQKKVYAKLMSSGGSTLTVSSTVILDQTPPVLGEDGIDALSSEIKESMVANLKFNEGSGTAAFDSAKTNDGTISGASWNDSGVFGQALSFDGNDDVHIENNLDINLGIHEDRSVSVWFKVVDKDLIDKQVIYEEGGGSRGLNIYIDSGVLYVGGWNAVGGESNWRGTWLSTSDIENNKWHHVVLTLNGFEDVYPETFRAYLDGQLYDSGDGSQLWAHSGNIVIGNSGDTKFHDGNDSGGKYFTGSIDELAIFNSSLLAEEVQTLYSSIAVDKGDGNEHTTFSGKVSDNYLADTEIQVILVELEETGEGIIEDIDEEIIEEDDGLTKSVIQTVSPGEDGTWELPLALTSAGVYDLEIQAVDGAGNKSVAIAQTLTFQGLGEICGDHIDNNGNDRIDEGCSCGDETNIDPDEDGINFYNDNCPCEFNPTQKDTDGDGYGDACDNCVSLSNSAQVDYSGPGGVSDGIGDACQVSPEQFDCDTIPYITLNITRADNVGGGDSEERVYIGNTGNYVTSSGILYLRDFEDEVGLDMYYDETVNQDVNGMAIRRGPGWISLVLYGHNGRGKGREIMDVDFTLRNADITYFKNVNLENQGDLKHTDNAGQDEVYFYTGGITENIGQGVNLAAGKSKREIFFTSEDLNNKVQSRLRVTTHHDEFYIKYKCFDTGDDPPDPPDIDSDGILDKNDNCVNTPNYNQADNDGDGKGDVCDDCPNVKEGRFNFTSHKRHFRSRVTDIFSQVEIPVQTSYQNKYLDVTCYDSLDKIPGSTSGDFEAKSSIYRFETDMELEKEDEKVKISFAYDPLEVNTSTDSIYRKVGNTWEKRTTTFDEENNIAYVYTDEFSYWALAYYPDGIEPELDTDGDGILDVNDNCVYTINADQLNSDSDSFGDACEDCPEDGNKTEEGFCGCGVVDIDSDDDGEADSCGIFVCEEEGDSCTQTNDCPGTFNASCACIDVFGDNCPVIIDDCTPGDSCIQTNNCSGIFSASCICLDVAGDNCPCVGDDCPCIGPNCGNGDDPCVGPDCGSDPCTGPNCGNSGDDGKKIIGSIQETTKKIVENIKKIFTPISEVVSVVFAPAVAALQKIIDNPVVESINKRIAVPVVVAASALNVATAGFGMGQVVAFLRNTFGQVFLAFRRRKRKKWGVVYNSFTKEPIGLALIRVVSIDGDKVISSQVTDRHGRYFLTADPGKYKLEVSKDGFEGFSEHLQTQEEDVKFINLYHGQQFAIEEESSDIKYNIPLDPGVSDKPITQILRDKARQSVRNTLSLVGLGAGVVSFVITPTLLIGGVVVLQVFFYGLFYRIGHEKAESSCGVIKSKDNKPIDNVIIRIFDSEYNRVVDTTNTDSKGRYAILVGPSKYYVTYTKSGFKEHKTPVLDYSSKNTKGEGGIIVASVELEHLTT